MELWDPEGEGNGIVRPSLRGERASAAWPIGRGARLWNRQVQEYTLIHLSFNLYNEWRFVQFYNSWVLKAEERSRPRFRFEVSFLQNYLKSDLLQLYGDKISFHSKALPREKPLTNFYSYMGIEFISFQKLYRGKNLWRTLQLYWIEFIWLKLQLLGKKLF